MPPMRETADARRSPPFHWDGEKAVADWMNDFAADAKAHGVTDDAITIAKPLHLTVEHALFIASLVRRGGTWLISNWAYGLK